MQAIETTIFANVESLLAKEQLTEAQDYRAKLPFHTQPLERCF